MLTLLRDRFAHDNLPPRELWPEMDFSGLPELDYPERLNAAAELLDKRVAMGEGGRPALRLGDAVWSYADLKEKSDRIARVLAEEMGLVSGNRVLLRGSNNPMMVACWFGILKAGGIVVATMPLLRAKELSYYVEKAKIEHGLCDLALAEEMKLTQAQAPMLAKVRYFTALGDGMGDLDGAMAKAAPGFAAVETAATDVAIIAFTSGTTGPAKGTMHFHRDLIAVADCFPKHVVGIRPEDSFAGSPPLAFTFGLGAFVLFPLRHGASTVLIEKFSPQVLLETIAKYKVTGIYTAPTGYRAMAPLAKDYDLGSLRICVSAGEHLPKPTWEAWKAATGIEIIDGIGATEMLHIFISASGADIRPGATGKAIPGYRAKIVDADGKDAPAGVEGRLAVKGPTGCRYLDNLERQRAYVRDGWNVTGDVYRRDADGYFWYVARADDMIVSAGYNISGPEVENCLLGHPKVAECAVVAAPDEERGAIVKAFVVLKNPAEAGPATVKELQDHVKNAIAPYKYPRAVEFLSSLPRTETGKLQRFKLRQ